MRRTLKLDYYSPINVSGGINWPGRTPQCWGRYAQTALPLRGSKGEYFCRSIELCFLILHCFRRDRPAICMKIP